ncbi:MAG: hypothetical protein ABWY83_10365 [Actinomycetota bacterium]
MRSSASRFAAGFLLGSLGLVAAQVTASSILLRCWWCGEAFGTVLHTSFAVVGGLALIACSALATIRARAALASSDEPAAITWVPLVLVAGQLAVLLGHSIDLIDTSLGEGVLIQFAMQLLVAVLFAGLVRTAARVVRATRRAAPRGRRRGVDLLGVVLLELGVSSREPSIVGRFLRAPPTAISSV